MEINKIILRSAGGDITALDLTQDTAVEDTVLQDYTFHKANGERAVGTATQGEPVEKLPLSYFEIYDGVVQYLSNEGIQALQNREFIELNIPDSYNQGESTEEELTFSSSSDLQRWYQSFYPAQPEPIFSYDYYGETHMVITYIDWRNFGQRETGDIISNEGSITVTHIIPGEITEGDTYHITGIAASAFSGSAFQNIISIDLPKYIESIGSDNFKNFSSLLKISEIPATCINIGNNFLEYSTIKIKSFKVNGDNLVYDSRENCNALIETGTNTLIRATKGTTFIPDTIEVIGHESFEFQSISEIIIPNSVYSIEYGAFGGCSNLISFVFPPSVSVLSGDVLSTCRNLTSVGFSSAVSEVDHNCFALTNLTDIYYDGTVAQFNLIKDEIKNNSGGINREVVVHCTDGSVIIDNSIGVMIITYLDMHQVEIPVSDTIYPIDYANFPSEKDYGIQDLQNIVTISLPEGVRILSDNAFNFREVERAFGQINITTINLPESLSQMGLRAFRACSTLTSIGNNNVLPQGISYFNGSTFRGCTSLGNITLPKEMWSISSDYDFRDCGNLTLTLKCPGVMGVYSMDVFSDTTLDHIYVHPKYVEAYKENEFWVQYASVIEADPDVKIVSNVKLYDLTSDTVVGTFDSYEEGSWSTSINFYDNINHEYKLLVEYNDGSSEYGLPFEIYGYSFPDDMYENYFRVIEPSPGDRRLKNIAQFYAFTYVYTRGEDLINNWSMELSYYEVQE